MVLVLVMVLLIPSGSCVQHHGRQQKNKANSLHHVHGGHPLSSASCEKGKKKKRQSSFSLKMGLNILQWHIFSPTKKLIRYDEQGLNSLRWFLQQAQLVFQKKYTRARVIFKIVSFWKT